MRKAIVFLTVLGAGCAVDAPARTTGSDIIRYETTACFGACPIYTLTIAPDGRGTFSGRRFVAGIGEHAFRATPAQYRAFAAALAPYRPAGEVLIRQGSPLCKDAATDMPSVDIRWTGTSRPAHLAFYFGCDMAKRRAMADALRHAPDELPIVDFSGKR